MKTLILLLLFCSNLFSNLSLVEIDYLRSLSDPNSRSIILNGENFCNNYFSSFQKTSKITKKYQNFFMCKFSNKRNRFYIYMLAVEKNNSIPLKEFCTNILKSWPQVYDHMNLKFIFERKDYLDGFYIENIFNERILSFKDNYYLDQQQIKNQINTFILENRSNFDENNEMNDKILKNALSKINKIYTKIISRDVSNLDKVIKNNLDDIVRYKIFINDMKRFKSYSCNWQPGKDIDPYVKREKFSEFEKI